MVAPCLIINWSIIFMAVVELLASLWWEIDGKENCSLIPGKSAEDGTLFLLFEAAPWFCLHHGFLFLMLLAVTGEVFFNKWGLPCKKNPDNGICNTNFKKGDYDHSQFFPGNQRLIAQISMFCIVTHFMKEIRLTMYRCHPKSMWLIIHFAQKHLWGNLHYHEYKKDPNPNGAKWFELLEISKHWYWLQRSIYDKYSWTMTSDKEFQLTTIVDGYLIHSYGHTSVMMLKSEKTCDIRDY